jgi:hypothetical protein
MASGSDPVRIPVANSVHGGPTQTVNRVSGNELPSGGHATPGAPRAEVPVRASKPSLRDQVALLNKFLNDSGKPDQFRIDPRSPTLIQEVNPANGEVIAEYPAVAFPALARSLGLTRGVIDEHA